AMPAWRPSPKPESAARSDDHRIGGSPAFAGNLQMRTVFPCPHFAAFAADLQQTRAPGRRLPRLFAQRSTISSKNLRWARGNSFTDAGESPADMRTNEQLSRAVFGISAGDIPHPTPASAALLAHLQQRA